jgi:hypothetical protein
LLGDEVRELLRELLVELGARTVAITTSPEERTGVPARTQPLGGGEFLRVELGATSRTETIDAVIERAVRALRAAGRRWNEPLPAMLVGGDAGAVTADKLHERIGAYLTALAAIGQVDNTLLVVRNEVIAAGHVPEEIETARWPFIVKRVAAAREPGSSHGELADPDFYAVEFWYGATLIVYLRPPYALDFIRFRSRQVTRELSHLLPLLEPDPPSPAAIRRPDE